MEIKQIGIDIGKNSFHVIGLGKEGDIVLCRQFTRSRLIAFFGQSTGTCLDIAFEACSGVHWLAHQLIGHMALFLQKGHYHRESHKPHQLKHAAS